LKNKVNKTSKKIIIVSTNKINKNYIVVNSRIGKIKENANDYSRDIMINDILKHIEIIISIIYLK
jgi:hypothetical protein